MDIRILGTRGEIEASAPYHRKHSGVLINDTLLLDCGEKQFLDYDPRYILITHLHPDHAFFVRGKGVETETTAEIYAPEPYKQMPIIVAKKPFTCGSYHIRPIPTIHSLKVKSQGYIVEHKNKKIFYTGDMIWIETKYHRMLANIDLVITEASYIRKGGLVRRDQKTAKIFGHTGIANLIHLFKPFTQTIVLTHFGTWFYEDMKVGRRQIAQLARENDLEIIVGYDGLELKI